MTERTVQLTPLTINQFKVGDNYGDGKVVAVGPAEMIVDFPEKPKIELKVTEAPQTQPVNSN